MVIADTVRAELAPIVAQLATRTTPAPLAVSTSDAAAMLGVHPTVVRNMIRSGALPAVVLPTMSERRVPVWALRQLVGDPGLEMVVDLREVS